MMGGGTTVNGYSLTSGEMVVKWWWNCGGIVVKWWWNGDGMLMNWQLQLHDPHYRSVERICERLEWKEDLLEVQLEQELGIQD